MDEVVMSSRLIKKLKLAEHEQTMPLDRYLTAYDEVQKERAWFTAMTATVGAMGGKPLFSWALLLAYRGVLSADAKSDCSERGVIDDYRVALRGLKIRHTGSQRTPS